LSRTSPPSWKTSSSILIFASHSSLPDGNILETEDIEESVGDGGVDSSDGDGSDECRRDDAVGVA
jgi:hypothetical protein